MELLCVQPSAAMDGVGNVYPSSWSHTHVPSVLPIPPTFPESQSIHWLPQTSSHMEWGGNCHGRRAEGAGGSLRPLFHQENAAPNVSGSICAPVLAAGSLPVPVACSGPDACLHASPPRSRQDVCSVVRASQSSGFVWKRDACRGLTQAHHAWDARAGCRPQPCPAVRAGCLRRQQDLFRVLKAYTLYRPEEGYCQAQAPIAAVLLMHMPAEVRAHSSGDRLAPPRGCGALWGADEWGVHLRAIQSAPGVLCCFPPSPMAPGRRPQ